MSLIIPIQNLKDTSAVSDLCHQSDEPIFITKHGNEDMVIMSVEYFEADQNRWKLYSAVEASEQDIREGNVKDARQALSSLKGKHGL